MSDFKQSPVGHGRVLAYRPRVGRAQDSGQDADAVLVRLATWLADVSAEAGAPATGGASLAAHGDPLATLREVGR